MLNRYDWKKIIKRIIIGVGIAFILFNINKCNAYALVYKGPGRNDNIDNSTKTGSLNNSTATHIEINVNSPINNNYDYIAFKLVRFNFSNSLYSVNETQSAVYCSPMTYNSSTNSYYCSTNTVTGLNNGFEIATTEPSITNSIYLYGNNTDSFCTLSSEYQDYIICPITNNTSVSKISFDITSLNQVSGVSTYYSINISKSWIYLNNDSTDIVNGLSGIQTQQSQTNTIISDSNTSSSSTSANSGFNSMNSQITQQVDSIASINTYNTIINNFFTQINNSTCSPISLPMPFVQGQNIVLPCIGTEINNSAPTLWTFWRFMCAGIIGFALWGNMIAFIKSVVDPYNIGANNLPLGGGK